MKVYGKVMFQENQDVVMEPQEENPRSQVPPYDTSSQPHNPKPGWPPNAHQEKEGMKEASFKDKLTGHRKKVADIPNNLIEKELVKIEFHEGNKALPRVLVDDSIIQALSDAWENTVIIKLLGKDVGYKFLLSKIKLLWKSKGEFEMIDVGRGYFQITFSLKEDMEAVLDGGPWVILDHYLTIRKWAPDFHPATNEILKTLAWVRFPELNMVYYEENVLLAIASAVGSPRKVDSNTLQAARGRFARVCVEVDLTKALIGKIWIGGHWVRVEYESLHHLCTSCGIYGHPPKDCPNKKHPGGQEKDGGEASRVDQEGHKGKEDLNIAENENRAETNEDNDGTYGDWMVDRRSNKFEPPSFRITRGGLNKGYASRNKRSRREEEDFQAGELHEKGNTSPDPTRTSAFALALQEAFKTGPTREKQTAGYQNKEKRGEDVNIHQESETPVVSSSNSESNGQDITLGTIVPNSFPPSAGSREDTIAREARPPDTGDSSRRVKELQLTKGFDICSGRPLDADKDADNTNMGAANKLAKCHIKELIKSNKPSILCILEPHISFSSTKKFWDTVGYEAIAVNEASGHSGGIWVMSNLPKDEFEILLSTAQAITFKLGRNDKTWAVTSVYGSPNPASRGLLWDHLRSLKPLIKVPWLVLGDFNEILLPSEVSGGSFYARRADNFSKVLEDCELMDLGAKGSPFTWRRNTRSNTKVAKRLDRALSNIDWRTSFPEATVMNLYSAYSDHNPVGVFCCGLQSSKKDRPFRLEAAWARHPLFEEVVKEAWEGHRDDIIKALKATENKATDFNKNVFGNIFKRKKELYARLKGLQRTLDTCRNSRLLEKELRLELDETLNQEEVLWFQKSRELWVKHGNKNTKFFHTQTLVRRKRNKIEGLFIDNIWCTDNEKLEHEVSKFFKSLFQEEVSSTSSFEIEELQRLSPDEAIAMMGKVTKEEVWGAVKSMKAYKAPGPDGFQPFFYQKYWSVVGDTVFELVRDAFKSGATVEQARAIRNTIAEFCAASGLRINTCKSNAVCSPKVPRSIRDGIENTDSFVWKGILKARSRLSPGFVKRIGNGRTTRLWKDTWIGDAPLWDSLDEVMQANVQEEAFVDSIIMENEWMLEDLLPWCPPKIIEEILTIHIPSHHFRSDILVWKGTANGKYSAQNGYAFLSNYYQNMETNVQWKKIWRLRCEESVRHFVWLLCHNAIPTNSLRASRGLSSSNLCPRCLLFEEHMFHCLRDCKEAAEIWGRFGFLTAPQFYESNFQKWLDNFAGFDGTQTGDRDIKFLCILHGIWKHRNARVFGKVNSNVSRSCFEIAHAIELNTQTFSREVSLNRKDGQLISWCRPDQGHIKLNTDGSSIGNPGPAGVGGLFRDSNGKWLCGFSGSIGKQTNMSAELMAIKHGLLLGLQRGFGDLIVEVDCLEAINLIKNEDISRHQLGSLIQDIRAISNSFAKISLKHVYREANHCADGLAKMGSQNNLPYTVWESPPSAINLAVLADSSGVSFPRA
ncbi:ribonuclease H [Senna tora]|uniref:Ribonuclease H n=1 Tax=Senna tora TaxID=362788 RepID=A0A835CBS9_9FABA|nr:ribonuclease H [Senna tora]